jgi:CheY-like chemotaxis protein
MDMTQELLVLMVEDSEDDAMMTVRELERGDYRVKWERVDTEEAMTHALWEKQHWDVILCDYVMPKFSAGRALELVQKSGLDIPFIIISGAIGETIAVEAMKAGAHDYLMKGKIARLGAAIEREMREVKVRKERSHVEGRLRDTLDYLMEGCQIFGFDWKCLYINDSAVAQVHKGREDLLGRTLMEAYPGMDETELFVALTKCMKERKPQRIVGELTLPDDSRGSFDMSVQPVPEGLMLFSLTI